MAEPASSDAAFPPLERLLLPQPQRLLWLGRSWVLPPTVRISAPDSPALAAGLGWLEEALAARGHDVERGSPDAPSQIEARLEPLAFEPARSAEEAYALEVEEGRLHIASPTTAGLQHGLATATQLVTLAEGNPGALALPCLSIADWPDFQQRGAMLDVSRDKVPTLATAKALIDRLARWKMNQLQLYMEHTFAYPGHEVVWQHASPLTPAEVRELDAYCADRHVQLVPNQNSFGHMHRWLVHEPYRALAECPEGFDHPWNWSREPYGLCAVDPASLTFLTSLYDALLPNFRSRLFNVGLDETIDLGHGRSKAACEERGTEQVYLEFLHAVHERVRRRGRRMQFWGDIIVKRPELISELPKAAIALEWGYEADHPFAEHLAKFQEAGLEFYVCPGTSSWNSIAGRTDNAILNLSRAALAGHAANASGLLVTDWGDHGHLQPLAVSYLGLLLGAGFSWNASAAEHPFALDVPALLDRHAFFDSASVLGKVAYDLGNTYRETGSLRPNASVLFWSLIRPDRLFSQPGVTPTRLEAALDHLERASEPLPRARPLGSEGALVVAEFGWARDLLRFACRLGLARSLAGEAALGDLSHTRRAPLADELEPLIDHHHSLWLARNREGGLADSAGRLKNLLRALRA
jgi:hexosaminidase